jgi:diketogulonate reductase-like aldo/keto reductase
MERRHLNNGYSIPVIATGTNRMNYDQLYQIIKGALSAGLSHFDSARDYGNEKQVGQALYDVMQESSIARSDLFVTTKVGNSQQVAKNMRREIEQSLLNLQTDYIDIWLLHWPQPDCFIENIKQMNQIMQEGLVKAIGIANPRVRHLELLKKETGIVPQVIQIEHHPFRLSRDILEYCNENQICVQAYSPLCFMIDKLKENVVLKQIAAKYGKSLGQIVLRWHYQHGIVPVFRTTNPKRFKENVDIFDFEINKEDMNAIFSLDEDFKFIPESLHCFAY